MHPKPWRLDLLFSYWVFAWFLLFVTGIVETSPLFALVLVVAEVTCSIVMQPEKRTIAFVLANVLTKLIPLAIVVQAGCGQSAEVWPTLGLLVVYLLYLHINGRSVSQMYLGARPFTPLSDVLAERLHIH